MDLWRIWAEFGLCLLLIGVAGTRLIRQADLIASLTGMSRHWIGMTLVATVTSLPELVTGATAVLGAQAPALATGDALGSCVLNLALLAVLEPLDGRATLFASAARAHRLSAAVGAGLLALVALEVLGAHLAPAGAPTPGLASGVIAVVYVVVLVLARRADTVALPAARSAATAAGGHLGGAGLRRALIAAALASLVIVGAGTRLPYVGVALGEAMGWSTSFVGSLFIATATSAPEMVTTWAAWRTGALDMALGNLLGSNLFDLLVLAFDDLLWTRGPILAEVPLVQAGTATVAATMSAGVAWCLGRRAPRVVGGLTLAGAGLGLLYGLHLLMLYRWAA